MKKTIIAFAILIIIIVNVIESPVYAGYDEKIVTENNLKFNKIELENALDDFIEERKSGTAGVSFAVFDNAEMIIRKDYGHTDVANGVLVDEESVFEWGSVTKLLVWVSAMQLSESSKLDLYEDIEKYLPDNFLSNKKFDRKITYIDLMNHQAGFQETVYPVETTDTEKLNKTSLEKALVSSMPNQIYEPGTVTAYSNWGAALAAYIIENITGQDFADYVHENIFDRLGMKHTALKPDWRDNLWVKEKRGEMNAYSYFDTEKEDFGSCISNILLYPAGAAAGTSSDFYLFAKALIPGNDTGLFKDPETLKKLYEPTLYYSKADKVRNSHGFWTLEYCNTVYGHAGNTIGFTASIWIDIENRTAVAVMSNEQGEIAYNYGLHPLIFGQPTLTPGGKANDISGIYFPKRTFESGFGRIYKYISGIMPVSKTSDGRIFNIPGGMEIIQTDDVTYIQDTKNGMTFPMRIGSGNSLESFTSDYEKFSMAELLFAWFLIIGTILCFITFLSRSIYLIIKIVRKKSRDSKVLLFAAGIAIFSILLPVLWFNAGVTKLTAVINIAFIVILGMIPVLCFISLFDPDFRKSKSSRFLAGISFIPFLAMIFMQSYKI
jgi:CubicO group peptidase (beta-lactamase class C family)